MQVRESSVLVFPLILLEGNLSMGSEGSSPEWLELSSELASPLPSGGPSGLEFVYGGGQFYAPVADFLEGTRLPAVH